MADRARRGRRAWFAAVVVLGLLAGCSSSGAGSASSSSSTRADTSTTDTPTTSPSTTLAPRLVLNLEEVTSLTALGDSVPAGTACNCTPYPQLAAADIAKLAGHRVQTVNDAAAGYESKDVRAQLDTDHTVIGDVERSQVVTVEIGANDVGYSAMCGTTIQCYERKIPQLDNNLRTVVARILHLTAGHEVAIVLLDYWNVWLGGQYAKNRGPAYVAAANTVTDSVSDTISAIARSTRALYVDLRTAFRGSSNAWDETHLLAADGDHPNAAGHERITHAIAVTVAAHV
jgi:acyl-CoA thioesterase I